MHWFMLHKEQCEPLNKQLFIQSATFLVIYRYFFQDWWCYRFIVAMINWSDTKLDKNDVKIKLRAKRKDLEYVSCKLCICELKYSKKGRCSRFGAEFNERTTQKGVKGQICKQCLDILQMISFKL